MYTSRQEHKRFEKKTILEVELPNHRSNRKPNHNPNPGPGPSKCPDGEERICKLNSFSNPNPKLQPPPHTNPYPITRRFDVISKRLCVPRTATSEDRGNSKGRYMSTLGWAVSPFAWSGQ
eukprot:1326878-Amorphochlora_amoeboformis.AAC.1